MIKIDAIAARSRYNNTHTNLRISLLMILLITCITVDWLPLYVGVLGIMVATTLWLTRLKPLQLFKILSIPGVFVAVSVLIIILSFKLTQPEGNYFPLVHLGKVIIYTTRAQLREGITALMRSFCGISIMLSISLTMPMDAFIKWMRMLRLPITFIELFTLCYRFIFILIEEAMDMLIASEMRFGFQQLIKAPKTINLLASSLFMRTFTRFEDMSQAMALRFYE